MTTELPLSKTSMERPSFVGLRRLLDAFIQRVGNLFSRRGDACWPDDLNDHYLRDIGVDSIPRTRVSDPFLHLLRAGPRAL